MSRTAVLTNAQWERIEPLMPSSDGSPGRPFQTHRLIVEGIIYRFRAGIPWRDLPESFGPWQRVWKRHRHFGGDGTWDEVRSRTLTAPDAAGMIDWEVSVASTVNRADQHATNFPGHTGGPVELHEPVRGTARPRDRQVPRWADNDDPSTL